MTITAYGRIRDAIAGSGRKVRNQGEARFRASCPGHGGDAGDLNLSVFDTETRVNLVCHSHQCEPKVILEAVGLTVGDRYDGPEVHYRYDDNRDVIRLTGGKGFRQAGNRAATSTLYRAGQVTAAVAAGQVVFLVEGEEDVHALEAVGQVATTAPQGASNFAKVDPTPLTAATVVAVVDRDAAGARWADTVATVLDGVAAHVVFRQARTGKDVSDHLTAGHDVGELDPWPDTDTATVEFWDERPVLARIRQHAQARRVGPWAVLAGVLVRIVASVPPSVVLPPLVGGYGSLNLFAGIVAPSGGGKGASQAAAKELAHLRGGVPFNTATVGSGEGIPAAYVRREVLEKGRPLDIVQHAVSCLFDVPEVDTLAALGQRKGSTLLAELRKVWSGEPLGFQNVDVTRRLPVDAHAYRAGLVVGIQPARAGGLLDDVDGGTPQRFVWLPAADPDAPATPPDVPEPLQWTKPNFGRERFGRQVMEVCQEARDTIDQARLAGLRGDADALDGHALFTRLKVAAALALLDEHTEVGPDDWRLAGRIMARSDLTRQQIRDQLADAARRANRGRAEARAEAEVIVADRMADRDLERVARGIVKRLGKAVDGMTRADLRRAAPGRDRPQVDAVVDDLVDAGTIVAETFEGQGRAGTRYRLAGVDTATQGGGVVNPSTPPKPHETATFSGGHTGGRVATPPAVRPHACPRPANLPCPACNPFGDTTPGGCVHCGWAGGHVDGCPVSARGAAA